jgi:hypothetical protein
MLKIVGLVAAGCSQPSAAMKAAEAYGEMGARTTSLEAFTVEPVEVSYTLSTNPAASEGVYAVCQETYGTFEWSKAKALAEKKVGKDRLVELEVAVCMRPENGSCNRPNLYTMNTIMREQAGQWKVAGSSCVQKRMVR